MDFGNGGGRGDSESVEARLDRLVQRVDKTIEQCRRFEEMAEVLVEWAGKWPASALQRWLEVDELDNLTREMALVALVLKGSRAAGAAIAAYAPVDRGVDHELFHQVVRFEWEKRFEESGVEQQRAAMN